MLTFLDIVHIASGQLLQGHGDMHVQHLLLDSRKIYAPESSVFFAIRGERHDGHQYLLGLYQQGVRQFVIEKPCDLSLMPLANVVLVSSSVVALQAIVAKHRQQFHYPVIGITGSNAKTIVKEWLSQLLAKDYQIVRSPRSYNSQIGVPLSVWAMQANHSLGIFEAGISRPSEMGRLQKIIQPSIGIFTNIGTAHDEGFENAVQKISEKLLLFTNAETLVYCEDHVLIHEEILKHKSHFNTFSWSTRNPSAAVYILAIDNQLGKAVIKFIYNKDTASILLPFTDEASIENAMHCLSVLLLLNIDLIEINTRLQLLQPVAMRLELKQGINGCYLIDDSYNNDFAGLVIAINFLEQQQQTQKKCLILSDMFESAVATEQLYQSVASLVQQKNIHQFIGIGEQITAYSHLFTNAVFYPTTTAFLEASQTHQFAQQTILIKGARAFKFENIVTALQQKVHGTVLEINLDALSHNLNYYKSLLLPQTKIMVMVKAFAYGSGSYEVANLLQYHRVDYLGVAYTDEGLDLRTHGIGLPIMVMNPSEESFSKMQANHLEPEIYSFKILNQYLDFIGREQLVEAKIHLKLDTGMHRLGFEIEDIENLISILVQNSSIKVVSMFSHLAGADEAQHNAYSMQQMETFETMARQIEAALGYTTIKHVLNSAGISRFTNHQYDMVRLGIGLYGVDATAAQQNKLQSVGTLKTIISQIKDVPAGATIGYSRKGVVLSPIRIATIAIGYADGYDRRFSRGVGSVYINGKHCPVVGNVCMDMTMIDITHTQAKEGDAVEIFGRNISLINLATQIDTIPYEILTNVSGRVKRVFYSE